MNIKEAKNEVMKAVKIYLEKDEHGEYRVPVVRQRPLFLQGAPGLGKTAIMEQVASELDIALVSYSMTHHTRQSAIGLPFLKEVTYGGKTYTKSEYTMSEIIASVYDVIEKTGKKEGILFLDEINCVSETLAPAMLLFLQYKRFGNLSVPEGWVVVTAGNPPQYNKSVKDFDVATQDRLKMVEIEPELKCWKEYAYNAGIHPAITAFLETNNKYFYDIKSTVNGKEYITARGWEDLSQVMKVYEQLGFAIDYDFVVQYLQDEEIARDFAAYYELYNKYKNIYRIPEILEGSIPENSMTIKNAPFDEKLSLLGLLLDSLGQEFISYYRKKAAQEAFFEQLGFLRSDLKEGRGSGKEILERQISSYDTMITHRKKAGMIDREQEKAMCAALQAMNDCLTALAVEGTGDAKGDFLCVKKLFDEREQIRQKEISDAGRHLTHAFEFLARVFGEGQEMVIFLSELSAGYYSLKFVSECGNDAYYKYNKLLLLKERTQELKDEAMELLGL